MYNQEDGYIEYTDVEHYSTDDVSYGLEDVQYGTEEDYTTKLTIGVGALGKLRTSLIGLVLFVEEMIFKYYDCLMMSRF